MWHFTRRRVEQWAETLLHIHDTPQRTAAAFALGVAIGFSPFFGLHIAMGLLLAFLFNLNRVAVMCGLLVNVPWVFMGPYYAAATALGAWLSGTPMPPQFLAQFEAVRDVPGWWDRGRALIQLLRPLVVPFTLGSLVGTAISGFLAYRLTLAFLLARRRHHGQSTKPSQIN
jgi:uncharacterized protein